MLNPWKSLTVSTAGQLTEPCIFAVCALCVSHIPNSMWRPIAWCSFKLAKYDQAQKYYERILEHKASAIDHMNAGHNFWANNQIENAIQEFHKSLSLLNDSESEFTNLFFQDKQDLLEASIDEDDISIMIDQILFNNKL